MLAQLKLFHDSRSQLDPGLTEVQFSDRTEALRSEKDERNLSFLTTYNPAAPNLKKRFSWNSDISFNSNLSRFAHIFHQPPNVSCRTEKSFKDVLFHAKLDPVNHTATVKTCTKKRLSKGLFSSTHTFLTTALSQSLKIPFFFFLYKNSPWISWFLKDVMLLLWENLLF